MYGNNSFWRQLSQLTETHSIVIDRPRGSPHPRYPETIYPLDYGYLEETTSSDGYGIDVWLGSLSGTEKSLTGILCTFDTLKRDLEIKLLIGCTEEDAQIIQGFHRDMHPLYIANPILRST